MTFISDRIFSFTECKFDPVKKNGPLPIKPKTTSIMFPQNGQNVLILQDNDKVEFICPGGKIVLKSIPMSDIVLAICSSNGKFNIDGDNYSWDEIQCNIGLSKEPFAVVEPPTNSCGDQTKEFKIGFKLSDDRFIEQFLICFNTNSETTLYVRHQMSINSKKIFKMNKIFKKDSIFEKTEDIKQLYNRSIQRSTINELLGWEPDVTEYIDQNKMFTHGHIAPVADFFYYLQQKATYRYSNVAPQWSTINSKNWNFIEQQLRKYAKNNHFRLEVWTGTYGIATLPHKKNGQVDLYLGNTQKTIPVPALFWKLFHDPKSNECIVLITLNNPYQPDNSIQEICDDISPNISWLKWTEEKKKNKERGYSYACYYKKFRETVPYPTIDECEKKKDEL